MTIKYYLIYTGIPINFGITALLGFLVGTAIAGQTFYNFTLENIKQFGALKAMGMTNLRIVGMILLQATGRRFARLRDRRRAGGPVRLGASGGRSWPSSHLVAAADHRRRDRLDLRPVQPAQRAAGDPARAGDRVPLSKCGCIAVPVDIVPVLAEGIDRWPLSLSLETTDDRRRGRRREVAAAGRGAGSWSDQAFRQRRAARAGVCGVDWESTPVR